jgi:hypothetical protein
MHVEFVMVIIAHVQMNVAYQMVITVHVPMNVVYPMVIIAHVQIVLECLMAQHMKMNVEPVMMTALMTVCRIVPEYGEEYLKMMNVEFVKVMAVPVISQQPVIAL